MDSKQNPIAEENDPEILDPKRRDNEISDPEKEYGNREFPKREDNDLNDKEGAVIDEPAPEVDLEEDKIVPKEDTYYLTDEDGNIIKEPSRESESSKVSGFARR
ncbi:hypothetical protein B0E43_16600 [Algoriphagus sp. A40]|nr:hypothetical protein B0E43_16600 [Algoriphagus sp. A40]